MRHPNKTKNVYITKTSGIIVVCQNQFSVVNNQRKNRSRVTYPTSDLYYTYSKFGFVGSTLFSRALSANNGGLVWKQRDEINFCVPCTFVVHSWGMKAHTTEYALPDIIVSCYKLSAICTRLGGRECDKYSCRIALRVMNERQNGNKNRNENAGGEK